MEFAALLGELNWLTAWRDRGVLTNLLRNRERDDEMKAASGGRGQGRCGEIEEERVDKGWVKQRGTKVERCRVDWRTSSK